MTAGCDQARDHRGEDRSAEHESGRYSDAEDGEAERERDDEERREHAEALVALDRPERRPARRARAPSPSAVSDDRARRDTKKERERRREREADEDERDGRDPRSAGLPSARTRPTAARLPQKRVSRDTSLETANWERSAGRSTTPSRPSRAANAP